MDGQPAYPRAIRFLPVILVFLGAAALPASGHGFVDEEIAEVTKRLERKPGDGALLLRRATLHRIHEDRPAARADLLAVEQDSPRYQEAQLHLARLEREAGNRTAAEAALGRYFARGGVAPEAFREQARLAAAAGRGPAVAAAWDKYFALTRQATADEFREAAEAMEDHGETAAARRTVLAGLEHFGHSIPLQQRAAAQEMRAGNVSEAGERLKRLRDRYPTLLPRLWHEEGKLWQEAGHPARARASFEQALAELHQLPPARQAQPGLRKLRTEILHSLKR